MKSQRKWKIIFILLVVMAVSASGMLKVFATTKSELNEQQNDLDAKINEKNQEIESVQEEMSQSLEEIREINAQIANIEDEIVLLNNQITSLNTQIEESTKKIEEQEQKLKEQQELLDKRLVALYESGTTSYVDMLLSSDGLVDFLSKYFLISQLAEYDTELLEGIEETKTTIEAEKATLEQSKAEIENAKNDKELKTGSLELSKKEKDKKVSALSAEEKQLESEVEQFEKDKKEVQNEIARIMAKEAEEAKKNQKPSTGGSSSSSGSSSSTTPSAKGFISPIPGKTKRNITTGWLGYSGHTGVDFACAAGTTIQAAKGGTVEISTALKNANGSYRSYGEYILINHHDGTMSLYAHGLANSRRVQKGDTVSQGQQIMSVGSTGNSTGNHLHFEIWLNGVRVNPTNYLP